MKTALPALVLLTLFLGCLRADEAAPSPSGRSIVVTGKIAHFKTPKDVTIEGAPGDGTYAEEVYGKSFTATVEGLPAGTYTVKIDLAEVHDKKPNQRVMKITSGNVVLADNLDLFVSAGFARAHRVEGKVNHDEDAIGGPLVIGFRALRGDAKFNAIHIYDAQGHEVAGVKGGDLAELEDPAATRVPQITDPVIYTDPDKPMDARIDDLIRRMSLAEKVGQLMNAAPAIPRLNVPEYNYWNECLHGVARNGHATVFPQAIGMAASWNDDLINQVGHAIAVEGRAKYNEALRQNQHGIYQGLTFWTPNVNIFRDPRWGRGQETYGEDPCLTAHIGVALVKGLQGNDPTYLEAMACAKHFAVHSGPEHGRNTFNVNPASRDLYETYLPQFQALVEEGHVGNVMAAYNSIYNVPCACDPWLLTDLLRHTWGFRGHVVGDSHTVANISATRHYAPTAEEGVALAIKAGLDLECGVSFHALTKSVAQGFITEKEIDVALHRVLGARFQLGMFDPPARVPFSSLAMTEVESPEHLALARKVACESMVLLKNEHLLPLDKTKLKRLAVVGPNADVLLSGNYSGSPTSPITILHGIRDAVGPAVSVDYVKGCARTDNPKKPQDTPSPEEFQKAVATAAAADAVIFVGGLDTVLEGEEQSYQSPGFFNGDRTAIEIPPSQEKMLEALQATGKPVVFVNCSGSAIAMPWAAAHIPAILQAWYPGGQGGAAVADVLFGDYNPAGRLPITLYEKTADLPDFSDYRMANRTYRYFTGKALFSFGFGLSYTAFDYLPLTPPAATLGPKDTWHLVVPVKNSGDRDGEEVVQVYLRHLDSPVPQPIRSLIAFKRVPVAKGETVHVAFEIPVEWFHYWSVEKKAYVVDPGSYEIEVGAASSDIRQTCRVTVRSS